MTYKTPRTSANKASRADGYSQQHLLCSHRLTSVSILRLGLAMLCGVVCCRRVQLSSSRCGCGGAERVGDVEDKGPGTDTPTSIGSRRGRSGGW